MATATTINARVTSKVTGRTALGQKTAPLCVAPLRQRSKAAVQVTASMPERGNDARGEEVSAAERREAFMASRRPALKAVEPKPAAEETVISKVASFWGANWKSAMIFSLMIAGSFLAGGRPATASTAAPAVPNADANANVDSVVGVADVQVAAPVVAASANEVAQVAEAEGLDSGDTAWMLTSTALVLFMTIPGLSLFYGGLVGSKNVLSILMICFTLTCVMSIIWVACGYSLAFTEGSAFIGGLSKTFLSGVTATGMQDTFPEPLWVMFQGTFAIITPALIIGSFAERFKFSSLLLYCIAWSFAVYFPFAHMVWGGGYLESLGLLDFAGGIVVHLTAGSAALLACMMVGPRKTPARAPHNLPMVVVGTGMLWVGWFGFNAGSAGAANGVAAMAMVATQVAASAAGIVWMLMDWIEDGKPTVLGICTGAVAGLVAVTPGAGFVSPMGALITGTLAGFVCRWFSTTGKKMFGYDDALDVWGVHGVGGFLGNQTTAIFGATAFGGTEVVASVAKQFGVHLYASCIAIAWSCAATFIILKVLDATIGLRPSEEGEIAGLDADDHGEEAYILGA